MRIVILTSIGEHSDLKRCRALRIDGYLAKPFKKSDLLQTLRRLFTAPVRDELEIKPSPEMPSIKRPKVDRRPLEVLVAEDNLINRKLVLRMLEKLGHSVTIAEDGRQAVEAFDRKAFDLILMDVQMPEMDGFSATGEIRAREAGVKRTPIVALTAHAMKADEERCRDAGMDGFLTKPIQAAELQRVIDEIISDSTEPSTQEEIEAFSLPS